MEPTESHWLNWCRLCAKDDVCSNVKVYINDNASNWNNVLLMAIRKYFNVHMRLEDELSGVLCKECYTLISELIDFAEHVNRVQAIFEVLRQTETNNQVDVDALRGKYGLRDCDWTHIIKPVVEHGEAQEMIECTKQEFIDLSEQSKPKNERIMIEDVPAESSIRRPRGRRKSQRNSAVESETIEHEVEVIEVQKVEKSGRELDDKPLEDHDIEFLPEAGETAGDAASDEEFKSESDLEETPSKRRSMECPWCGKIYQNRACYQKHLLRSCRKVEQKTKSHKSTHCEMCNKHFSSTTALKLHREGMHENVKRCVCDHCGKQLKTMTALNEHKLVHTEERPFSCAICRAGFKSRARLKIHSQIHEEPSYVCNVCGKKLQTRRTWTMHKLVHSEVRKFKCDACGALFKRSKTLKTHLLSHTGLRPYVCSYCGQSFACNANCRTHKLKKHPNELQKEEAEGLSSRLSMPTLAELRVMSQKLPHIKVAMEN